MTRPLIADARLWVHQGSNICEAIYVSVLRCALVSLSDRFFFVPYVGSLQCSLKPHDFLSLLYLSLLPGGGHHGDAGAEAASLPVASLWDLRVPVWAGGPLVPAVSDRVYV